MIVNGVNLGVRIFYCLTLYRRFVSHSDCCFALLCGFEMHFPFLQNVNAIWKFHCSGCCLRLWAHEKCTLTESQPLKGFASEINGIIWKVENQQNAHGMKAIWGAGLKYTLKNFSFKCFPFWILSQWEKSAQFFEHQMISPWNEVQSGY